MQGTRERPLNIAALPSPLPCGPLIVMLHMNSWAVCFRAVSSVCSRHKPAANLHEKKESPDERLEAVGNRWNFPPFLSWGEKDNEEPSETPVDFAVGHTLSSSQHINIGQG